ncbi:MAG: hypothetical protein ABIN95_13065 [Mucilaginibacter sp.]
MKRSLLTSLILIPLIVAETLPAMAGWPVGKKHYIITPSVSFYKAVNRWDDNGKLVSFDGDYASASFSVYGAYGISRNVDIIASIPITYQSSTSTLGTFNRTSPGDMQLGVNVVLKDFNFSNYITLYVGAAIPLYKNSDFNLYGMGNTGLIARLGNAGNLAPKFDYSLEIGGGQYFGFNAPQQFTYDATLIFKPDEENQVSLNFGGINSVSKDKSFQPNLLAVKNYNYTRASLGYMHSFSKQFSLQLSGFYMLTGKNTGQGFGGTLSALFRLPFH